MVNYYKLLQLLKKKGISSTDIRKQHIMSESTLQKMRISSGESFDEVKTKLENYQKDHPNFNPDVAFKTIEDICQILQCQPKDVLEWKIELNPEKAYSKDGMYGSGEGGKAKSIKSNDDRKKKETV